MGSVSALEGIVDLIVIFSAMIRRYLLCLTYYGITRYTV